MIRNSYLHIPKTFTRVFRDNIVFNENTSTEEVYKYWSVYPNGIFGSEDDYYTIPIDHQESVDIDELYNYSDISVSLTVSQKLFSYLLNGANKLLVIVDFDNIPRTPYISSATRALTANMYNVNLSLKPFNCYRFYKSDWELGEIFYIPSSEYVSYKVLEGQGQIRFDPPYTLNLAQSEVE